MMKKKKKGQSEKEEDHLDLLMNGASPSY